ITRIEEGKLLAFEVIEQKLHFERDVRLLDGKFEVTDADCGGGRAAAAVILTTRYRPLLYPRWMGSWMEARIVHTLHEHVLEEMRRDGKGEGRPQASHPSYDAQPRFPRVSRPLESGPQGAGGGPGGAGGGPPEKRKRKSTMGSVILITPLSSASPDSRQSGL